MVKIDTSDRYEPVITPRYYSRLPNVKINQSITFKCGKKSINGKICSIGNELVEVLANGKKYLAGMRGKQWEGKLI